jgi:hypothetical protein
LFESIAPTTVTLRWHHAHVRRWFSGTDNQTRETP